MLEPESEYENALFRQIRHWKKEVELLRAELASWQKAFGLLTTLHGSMPIDISDPLRMAKSIEGHVRAELEASETELRIVRASQAESNAEVERLRTELAVAKADLAVSIGHLSRLAAAYGCEDFTTAVDAALAAKE